ncbi:MAG: hypothetical protein ACREUI_03335 [Burkholderiales bacterium]
MKKPRKRKTSDPTELPLQDVIAVTGKIPGEKPASAIAGKDLAVVDLGRKGGPARAKKLGKKKTK